MVLTSARVSMVNHFPRDPAVKLGEMVGELATAIPMLEASRNPDPGSALCVINRFALDIFSIVATCPSFPSPL